MITISLLLRVLIFIKSNIKKKATNLSKLFITELYNKTKPKLPVNMIKLVGSFKL